MAALQCEICGGKLVGKPGGIFECDSCGMEYSTEWAKAKVQEIKGTVKIEGPVEVTGTVKVEGGVSVENLLNRAKLALEDEDWDTARELLDQVLRMEPKNAEAYLGLVMADVETPDRDAFADAYINGWIDTEDKNLNRCRQFAGPELKTWLEELEPKRRQTEEERRQETENLLKRGNSLLREEKWEDAQNCFNRVVEIDPENAEAYLGLVMADAEIPDRDTFAEVYISMRENAAEDEDDEEYEEDEEDDWYEGFKEGYREFAGEEYEEDEDDENLLSRVWQFAGPELTAWLEDLETKRQQSEEREKQAYRQLLQKMARAAGLISAGPEHTVGLREDGTAVAVGHNVDNRCKVSRWTGLVAVSAGPDYTVGLRADGTAVTTAFNKIDDWTDLVAVSAGDSHTVGLREDGTAVAVGHSSYGQCRVGRWTDLVAVSAGKEHTVGLRADGTAVAVGSNWHSQCEIDGWTGLVAVSAGPDYTVGLRADGTALTTGIYEVDDWTDLVAVSAGDSHTVGLRADGTAVAVGSNSYGQCEVDDWTDLVAVSAGAQHTVGLRADGTVVVAGYFGSDQYKVNRWKLFNSWSTWGQARVAALEAEKASIQAKLSTLQGGLLSGAMRRPLEARLAQIDAELKRL